MKFRSQIFFATLAWTAVFFSGCGDDDSVYSDTLTVPVSVQAGPFSRATAKAFGLKSGTSPQALELVNGTNLAFSNGAANLVFRSKAEVSKYQNVLLSYTDAVFDLTGDPNTSGMKSSQEFTGNYFQSISIPTILPSTMTSLSTIQESNLLDHIALSSSLGKQSLLDAEGKMKALASLPALTSATSLIEDMTDFANSLVRELMGKPATEVISENLKKGALFKLEAQLIQAAKESVTAASDRQSKSLIGETIRSVTKELAQTNSFSGVLSDTRYFRPLVNAALTEFNQFWSNQNLASVDLPDMGALVSSNLENLLNAVSNQGSEGSTETSTGGNGGTTSTSGAALGRTTQAQALFAYISGKRFSRDRTTNQSAGSFLFRPDQTYFYAGSDGSVHQFSYGAWNITTDGRLAFYEQKDGTLNFNGSQYSGHTETSLSQTRELSSPASTSLNAVSATTDTNGGLTFSNPGIRPRVLSIHVGDGFALDNSGCSDAQARIFQGAAKSCVSLINFTFTQGTDGGFKPDDVSGKSFLVSGNQGSLGNPLQPGTRIQRLAFHSNGEGAAEFRDGSVSTMLLEWFVSQGKLMLRAKEKRGETVVVVGANQGGKWFELDTSNTNTENITLGVYTKSSGAALNTTTTLMGSDGEQSWSPVGCPDGTFFAFSAAAVRRQSEEKCYSTSEVFTKKLGEELPASEVTSQELQ